METKNDVYVISLDAVDLNLLPISQTPGDGGAGQLWSESNLDSSNEYYEFVIKTDNTKDKNKPVIENVTCHICDVNVPKVYFNEHKNGFRHKFNRKVADTALKRLQLYAENEDISEDNDKLPSKHFCTECSIVIDGEDEATHKQSAGHRNSICLERFLNDFLNFYTNDREIDIIKDKKMDVKNDENSEQDVDLDKSNITEILRNTKKGIMEKEEKYNTTLNSDKPKYNVSRSTGLKDGDAFLEVFDGVNINKFKVTEMRYDAIVQTGVTSEYCMVCNQMFVKENRFVHLDSEHHYQNLRQKSLDKNCIRKINTSHHHCVLCNDYFTEYDSHVSSNEHLTNYRSKIISKYKKTSQDDNNSNKDISKQYSDVLKSNENKSSTHTNKNITSVNQNTGDSLVLNTRSSVAINEIIKISNKKLDPNSYFCKICAIQIPNNLFNITEHNNGRLHMRREQEIKMTDNCNEDKNVDNTNKLSDVRTCENSTDSVNNETNNLVSIVNSSVKINHKIFCDICNKWLGMKRFNRHKSRRKHASNLMKNYNFLLTYLDEHNLFCKVCEVNVSNLPVYVANHCTSSDHVNKYDEVLKAQSVTKVDDKRYYCVKCELYILNKNEYMHIESKEHMDKVGLCVTEEIDDEQMEGDDAEAVAVYSNTIGDSSDNATDRVQVNSNGTDLKQLNTNENLTNFQSKFTAQDNDYDIKDKKYDNRKEYGVLKSDENESSTHTNTNGDLITKGTSSSLVPSTSSSSAVEHVDSNSVNVQPSTTLADKLESIFLKYISLTRQNDSEIDLTPENINTKPVKKSHFCKTCEILIPSNPICISGHYRSRKHSRKLVNKHYLMKPTASLDVVRCIVCNLDLTNSTNNVFTHIEGEIHRNKYKEFCARNMLDLHLCVVTCKACGVKAGPPGEFVHCKGEKHKKNLKLFALRHVDERAT